MWNNESYSSNEEITEYTAVNNQFFMKNYYLSAHKFRDKYQYNCKRLNHITHKSNCDVIERWSLSFFPSVSACV